MRYVHTGSTLIQQEGHHIIHDVHPVDTLAHIDNDGRLLASRRWAPKPSRTQSMFVHALNA